MGPKKWLFSFVTIVTICNTNGYSSGAGFGACNNMIPGHSGSPQSSEVPFQLVPEYDNVPAGQTIELKLSASGNVAFKGFLVQAFDTLTFTRSSSPSTFAVFKLTARWCC